MKPEDTARAAARRLAPRLGGQLVPAVERALAGASLPHAALDQIAAWLLDAARLAAELDVAPTADALAARLDPPRGASPAIARAVLAALVEPADARAA